MAKHTFEEIY